MIKKFKVFVAILFLVGCAVLVYMSMGFSGVLQGAPFGAKLAEVGARIPAAMPIATWGAVLALVLASFLLPNKQIDESEYRGEKPPPKE